MELQGHTLPGYRVNEYTLIIQPPQAIEEKVRLVRHEFDAAFKVSHKIPGRPNVGLLQFMQYEMREQRIRERLKMVSTGYQPFKIELDGFGSYPSHTIFVNMKSRLGVQNLIREVRETAGALMRLNHETKPHYFNEPNINVAYKLVPWQYEKAWLEYSQKHFRGSFIADSMLLLKRREKGEPWQIVDRYMFQNMFVPKEAVQGELF